MSDEQRLSHVDDHGAARMVDVGGKAVTRREAIAAGVILMAPETLAVIVAGDAPKGDVMAAARLAGIQAAKRTGELIPLCHLLPIEAVEVDLEPVPDAAQDPRVPHVADQPTAAIRIVATARISGKTGVEMEALTAVSVAALTLYDMAKAIDRAMVIGGIHLVSKTGGRSEAEESGG